MQPVFKTTQPVEQYAKFQIGTPLPRAKFFATQTLHLVKQNQQIVNCRLSPLQLWPDQSIKWMTCEGVFPKAEEANQSLYITDTKKLVEPKRVNWVIEDHSSINIKTKIGDISLDLTKFYSLRLQNQVSATCHTQFTDTMTSLSSLKTEYEVVYDSQQHPLFCEISQTVDVIIENQTQAKLTANFCVYFADGNVISALSLHNTQAIVAHGGQWDLGNENSLYLKSFAIIFNYDARRQTLSTENLLNNQFYDYAQITQYSSGGDNWCSENHKTRNNIVELQHKGAKGCIILNDQSTEFKSFRPQPFMQIELETTTLFIQPQHFWQKFPTGFSSSSKRTVVDFADRKSGCEVELQAGEIKSHSLGFSLGKACSLTQLVINQTLSLELENIQQSKALPYINESLLHHPLQNTLVETTNSGDKWLSKREALDEFGWRNYGDLFADHEAAHFKGDGIFVSHYNNQYDPLFGFLKLWLLTGKCQYKALADNLFEHIINIDIYHTSADKPEYNNGMFWHTDHYVAAETASHRTYSKHQASDVYVDHAGGGGPGSHHCYSTGLAYYYLLSGNQQAKQVTLGLADWMQCIYEGDGTLLGLLVRAKNANHLKIPFTNKLLLGSGTGVLRNIFTNKYPLDRGTGNNVNVLLDCFEITQQQAYLRQVEYIILNTIGESDIIADRNLGNIEETWFYTIFLQAVAKYLNLVSQNAIINESICVIKAAFIHYASWMAKNETYYLANKEILEYPNDTWIGQDLRKIQILLCAHEITQNSEILQKANKLIDYVYPSLSTSEEKDYTRIQALIMQNYVDQNCIAGHFDGIKSLTGTTHKLNIAKLNKRYVARLIIFLKQYSIRREIDLLCVRISVFNRVFRK